MKDLLHPKTAETLALLAEHTPHAIMLTGNPGSGKRVIALRLAEQLLNADLKNHAYFLHMEPEGKTLTIDQVRALQSFVRLKTTGSARIRRIALLSDAHTMTTEAQNALLKLLEEPPADTVLILTAQGDKSLKPTIYSRVQRVHVRPLTKKQALDYAESIDKSSQAERAYSLSGGDAELLRALLEEDDSHKLVSAIEQGKKLLTGSAYERLLRVDELSKDKEGLQDLLAALKRIASAALKGAAAKNDTKLRKRWLNTLEAIYVCEAQTSSNTNTKLLLTDLFLNV